MSTWGRGFTSCMTYAHEADLQCKRCLFKGQLFCSWCIFGKMSSYFAYCDTLILWRNDRSCDLDKSIGKQLPLTYFWEVMVLVSPGVLSRELFPGNNMRQNISRETFSIYGTYCWAGSVPHCYFHCWVTQALRHFSQEQFVWKPILRRIKFTLRGTVIAHQATQAILKWVRKTSLQG